MGVGYREPLVEVRQGHVVDELAALASASVQLGVTSPPYFGLRRYAVEPVVWGGDPGCAHAWGESLGEKISHPQQSRNGQQGVVGPRDLHPSAARTQFAISHGTICQRCHGWLGHLGLEKSPWCRESLVGDDCTDQCYLGHLLQVCDGIWRVLRDDACLVWNMGDSFSSGGRVGHGTRVGHKQQTVRGMNGTNDPPRAPQPDGLKPKNLLNLPARFSIAMQGRGWILRNSFQWLKDNCMPGSQTDRPTVSHESLFLFTKRGEYDWDQDAIRQPHTRNWANSGGSFAHPKGNGSGTARDEFGASLNHVGPEPVPNPNGRNRRTGDWWDESLDLTIADMAAWVQHAKSVRDHGGLLLSPDGEPLGLKVNPQPSKMLHFASFPPRLVRPFILAGTSQVGCCSACKTPWRRVVARTPSTVNQQSDTWEAGRRSTNHHGPSRPGTFLDGHTTTLAWMPQCTCGGYRIEHEVYGPPTIPEWWRARQDTAEQDWPPVVPCTVLDPFAGTGVTGAVARALGRQSVLIDLSAAYCEFIQETLHADLPLFGPTGDADADEAKRRMQMGFEFEEEG